MNRAAWRQRLAVLRHDADVTRASWKEPAYRRLARAVHLPDGVRRVYCHHIRKTAGTSLHHSFLALAGEAPLEVERRIEAAPLHRTISGPYPFVAHQRRLLAQGHYLYGWSHLPAHRVTLPPRTFTVTILRDPVDRIVSLFSYLREGDAPGTPFSVPPAERTMARGDLSLFLSELPKKDLLRQLFTFSARFDVGEAADRIAACSCLLLTDDYESGVTALAQRLELPLAIRRARSTGTRVQLSDTERAHLRELLEPEYELMRRLGV
jgi:Sulfotransferase family